VNRGLALLAAAGTAAVTTVSLLTTAASASPSGGGPGLPKISMHGYAKGPAEHLGSAAGLSRRASASATRARGTGGLKGHPAPRMAALPPALGQRKPVNVPPVRLATGHRVVRASAAKATAAAGTDNASYSVASVFDTVPMADQQGRIAVTLTNTGSSTWSGYGLYADVYPSTDTNGTGTPLSSQEVLIGATVAPGQATWAESVTPEENPGSYEICFDMVNAAGMRFSAEGGTQYCAPYVIAQYPAQVTEQLPLPGSDVPSQQPSLSAYAVVPGGYPAKPRFTFAFRVLDGPDADTANVLDSSGWLAGNASQWAPSKPLTWGTTYWWQVAVTDVTDPADAGISPAWAVAPVSFTVGDAQPAVGGRLGNTAQADDGNPVMTSDLGGSDFSGSGKTVDPKSGNLSTQATDASVATAGPPLTITRTYNSLDPRTSQALGAGWSSELDMSLAPDPDGTGALILTLATGRQLRFAKNTAGGYAAPEGFYAVVTSLSGGGFTVTDQTATVYTFAQQSGTSWLVSKIADSAGRSETFGYAGGELSAITNQVSGRALHFTWSTPSGAADPHVASVSTDQVTSGGSPLTWTYSYSGDLLTSVCPPGTTSACTRYGYSGSGSHAATAVLNAGPAAYWRLGDPSGTAAAANLVPVNDLVTLDPPATEMNTSPGAAGPASGSTATGFDGTDSFVPMDGLWCSSPGKIASCTDFGDNVAGYTSGRGFSATDADTAIGLWFKTSAAGTVIASQPGAAYWQELGADTGNGAGSPSPSPSTPAGAELLGGPADLLWVNAAGDLEGYDTCDDITCTWLSSAGAVDDGKWHQAVLIPGQALYLDGQRVTGTTSPGSQFGGVSGPADLNRGATAVLGAGPEATWEISGNSATIGATQMSWFDGSIADVATWQDQLPGPGTVATWYQAETASASELNSITSPAGQTVLSASYRAGSDRVASLTDADGGTWTYGTPTAGASSAGFEDSVLGASPLDFWPLSDASGPDATDLVGNGSVTSGTPRVPAAYSGVTLGVAGPSGNPGATAAGFTGNGSQVTVAGGYFGGDGPETASLWFDTTSAGTLLSSSPAGSGGGGNPIAIWVDSSGCLDASAGTATLGVAAGWGCSTTVTDGKWHQVAVTLGPITADPVTGSNTQTATLYLDGKALGTATATPPALSKAGYTLVLGNGPDGDLTGSLADVAVYGSELTTVEIDAQITSLVPTMNACIAESSGGWNTTQVCTPALTSNTSAITVTNPLGGTSLYVYAGGQLASTVNPLGGVTRYGYDAAGQASVIIDPDGNATYTTHDAFNNVTATTTCAAVNDCQTVYTSYYEDLSNPLDPRNNQPTDNRDARSQYPSDPAYDTKTAYTADGLIASRTTPPTTACPSGCTTTYTWTTGAEAAVGGGTEPSGLLATVTTSGGGKTTYAYDANGDLAQVTDPLGMVTTYTYDNLGRNTSQTQVSSSYPSGLTTTYVYDVQDRLVKETDPPTTDRVTSDTHTKVTSYTYDADAHVLTATVADATGGDPSRTTTSTYDSHGELASVTDPLGNKTTYTYDAMGDKASETNPAGVTTSYAYDNAGNPTTVTLDGYTGNPSAPVTAENLVEDSRAYDPAGRLATETDVAGTTTHDTYYGDGKLASSWATGPGSSTQQDVHSYSYDAAGNQVSQTSPGDLVTNATFNADNQVTTETIDPSGVDRTVTATYDTAGNATAVAMSGGGATQHISATYNAMNQMLSRTVQDGSTDLTTSWQRGQRGLVTAETDPAGNTTTFENDAAGRPVVVTGPAVPTQPGDGSATVTASPVTMAGYDTFGDETEYSDADGNITKAAYDQSGQEVSITQPPYTPPGASAPVGGTTTMAYDSLGKVTSVTDPLGNVTKYAYDQLGDLVSTTDPGGGAWTYTYDPAGQQTSVTSPTGAQTQATYDDLGRLITATDLVRQDTSAAYTTSYGYDAAGNLTSQTSPTGVKTGATYNAVGEETSATDGAGNTTAYAYDLNGNLVKETLPDGTATTSTYDEAGRQTSLSDLSGTGTVLRTESAGYDANGNITSFTDFRGDTSTATYDATGMVLSQTEPVSASHSITVKFGYDLNGNPTAFTDGNGNTTYATYNPLGLPQTITEPHTAQYTTAADSQTTDSYNADGDLVTQDLPGGAQLSNTYDANGNLVTQSGSGASAATAARTFTYDTAGRLTAASTAAAGTQGSAGYQPATSETFAYDDRGLLLSAAGSAGSSTFTYNAAAQLSSVTDPAGTSSYTYDSAGRLATDASAASGVTGTYSYNSLDQVTKIAYGTGNDVQSFGYDNLHRLASDTIATASGSTVASIGYGYNLNNDVTTMTTTGLATAGGGTGTVTSTYGYDQAGRLTSWTATPSGGTATTTSYGYDDNGNLTSINGVTRSYDARDQLTSDGKGDTYSYSAAGNLTSETTSAGTTDSFSTDAYGQQITSAGSSYTWDALGRVVQAAEPSGATIALTYDGQISQLSSDGSATYSRDPAGQITGVNSTGGGKTIALNDGHNDLSGTFSAAGTALASSTTWDPWGSQLASTGSTAQVGYQGQWTDPGTGQTDMGARFYSPEAGGFGNQDTAPGAASAAAPGLHGYAGDNPMTLTDLSGHSPSGSGGAGTVTKADVDAAAARAAQAEQRAAQLKSEAARAAATAGRAARFASSAAAAARRANVRAAVLSVEASVAATVADAYYLAAQSALYEANYWQSQADAAFSAFEHDMAAYWDTITHPWEHWPWTAARYLIDAYKELFTAGVDAIAAWFWRGIYNGLNGEYQKWAGQAAELAVAALVASIVAAVDDVVASVARAVAAQTEKQARALAGEAAAAENTAAADEAYYQKLKAEYEAEQREAQQQHHSTDHGGHGKHHAGSGGHHGGGGHHGSGNGSGSGSGAGNGSGPGVGAPPPGSGGTKCLSGTCSSPACLSSLSSLAGCAGHAAVSTVTSTIHQGAQCLFHGNVVACAETAANIAVAVGTDGTGDAAIGILEHAGEDVAAQEGDSALVKAAEACLGGESFTASTKVLLANGKTVPISQLKPGDKVLATNTKTGKTQPETVSAVLVHYDASLYDIKIRTGSKTAVIDTTSSHLFWVPGTSRTGGRWIKADALKYGTHLRTSDGSTAIFTGGYAPRQGSGWMWDLTVPGDHDFYIDTIAASVLVHNCPMENSKLPWYKRCVIVVYNVVNFLSGGTNMPDEPLPTHTSFEYRDQHPTSGQGPLPRANPPSGGGTPPGGQGGSGNQGCSP
jgi:RHS repeat-associated protein